MNRQQPKIQRAGDQAARQAAQHRQLVAMFRPQRPGEHRRANRKKLAEYQHRQQPRRTRVGLPENQRVQRLNDHPETAGKQQSRRRRAGRQKKHAPPEHRHVGLPPHHKSRRHDDAEVVQEHLQRNHKLLRRTEQPAVGFAEQKEGHRQRHVGQQEIAQVERPNQPCLAEQRTSLGQSLEAKATEAQLARHPPPHETDHQSVDPEQHKQVATKRLAFLEK